MIRVLHIVLGLQVGGLEKFVLSLIDNSPKNIESYVVCLDKKGELGNQYPKLNIIELSKGAGISLRVLFKLIILVRKNKIDIIHTHNPSPHFYGAIVGVISRRAVIHTKHGRNYPHDKKKIFLNRISSFLTKKVVAVSKDSASICLDVERISDSKVITIWNGIDTNLFFQAQNSLTTDDKVRIGIVARLSEEKDHANLLQAVKELAVVTTNFHLDIIGGGPLQKSLEHLRDELGLEIHVSLLGMRHDVPALLQHLDIFVLSSTTEGISLTLLEAMATGLPVVATKVGGNPEVVVDGVTGFLVPPRNPSEMASALLKLLQDQKLRNEMGKKGRQRIVEYFSIKRTAKQYEDLYLDALGMR